METSSLKNNQPHLESVFGPLSEEDDSRIRTILEEVDAILLEIAHHSRPGRMGKHWAGTKMDAIWADSHWQ